MENLKFWILSVLLVFIAFLLALTQVYGNPVSDVQVYTIQRGDTLSLIAQKFFNDPTKWQLLWKCNPKIQDPHLIYEGQKIYLCIKPKTKTKGEIKQELVGVMFKVRGLAHIDEDRLEHDILNTIEEFQSSDSTYFKRQLLTNLSELYIKKEFYELTNAIISATQLSTWQDLPYLLAAIAWQESHFLNRRGLRNERSCFQIMPMHLRNDSFADQVENYPFVASTFVYAFLAENIPDGNWEPSLKKLLIKYNGTEVYADAVIRKFNLLKTGGI